MLELRQEYAQWYLPPDGSARRFCDRILGSGAKSLREAIRHHREWVPSAWFLRQLTTIKHLLDGPTSEEEEDRALALLLGQTQVRELVYLINALTWDVLDDELDEADLTQVARRLMTLFDREYIVSSILRWFFLIESEMLRTKPLADLTSFAASSPQTVKNSLAGRSVDQRERILDGFAEMALRGQTTHVREYRAVIDVVVATAGHPRTAELVPLPWEVFYTDLICTQLERGEFGLLVRTLPDMVNAGLLQAQRDALFNMLRRWDPAIRAMEQLIRAIGSERQQADMRRFIDTLTIFLDHYPQAQDSGLPSVIQAVISAITSVGNSFEDLVAAIQRFSTTIADFSVPALLGSMSDDVARDVVNQLSQQQTLALIPTDYKADLISRMLTGSTDDDDEQAILTVLRETKERSTAEFLQLAASATWERLDSSFDGTEYDQLEALFTF